MANPTLLRLMWFKLCTKVHKMDKVWFLCSGVLGLILLSFAEIVNGDFCDKSYSVTVRRYRTESYQATCYYYSSCGFWGMSRCRRSRSCTKYRTVGYYVPETRTRIICCEGFSGANCDLPTCSGDGQCYPGTCSNISNICECSSDFSGPFCNDMEDGGTFKSCGLALETQQASELATTVVGNCVQPGNDNSYYSDVRSLSAVLLNYDLAYITPSDVAHLPSDTVEVALGLVESYTQLTILDKNLTTVWGPQQIPCSADGSSGQGDPSPDNPYPSLQCHNMRHEVVNMPTIENGDILKAEVVSKTGGYKKYLNATNVVLTSYYTGITSEREIQVIFDLQPSSQCLWKHNP